LKLLVCGSRDWTDSVCVAYHMGLVFGKETDRLVIHGNCGNLNNKVRDRCVPIGADVISGWCATGVGAACDVYPVDHALDGPWPGAGPRRNARMLRESRPDRGLAFGPLWKRSPSPRKEVQPGLFDVSASLRFKHTGTGGMVALMLAERLPVRWVAAPGKDYVDLVEMPQP